jgi:transcriptional regulator with XRE-family HTH domain
MATETRSATMHLGRKISRIRELRGMKQEALAAELGVSQQAISKLEQSEHVDDEKLEMIGKALGVSTEAIKNFDEEHAINIISNTFHNTSNDNSSFYSSAVNYQPTFNPIDKLVQLYDEKIALYERMLNDKDVMIESLKSLLNKAQ